MLHLPGVGDRLTVLLRRVGLGGVVVLTALPGVVVVVRSSKPQCGRYAPLLRPGPADSLEAEGANHRDEVHSRKHAAALSLSTSKGTTPSGLLSCPPRSSVTTSGPRHDGQRPAIAVCCWALPLSAGQAERGQLGHSSVRLPRVGEVVVLGAARRGTAMSSLASQYGQTMPAVPGANSRAAPQDGLLYWPAARGAIVLGARQWRRRVGSGRGRRAPARPAEP